ncbi:hypothetical protein ACHAXS_014035 [Conticribra weissflogii]
MISTPSAAASVAFSVALTSAPSISAFSNTAHFQNQQYFSKTALSYRSLHHGPDIEPLTDIEKLGPDYTKLSKDELDRYGPKDLSQFGDFPSDQFDGGDSEMGLAGDGTVGLRKLGRDVSPHLARTLGAKIVTDDDVGVYDSSSYAPSYADELMEMNPGLDAVRAQQYENWATQNEIALGNRLMNERVQVSYESVNGIELSDPLEAGEEVVGLITLTAPLNGYARHDIMLRNPYMGFARFRAGFVGDACNDWSVTPSDGHLKQKEETHFAVSFNPRNPGVSSGYFVIETEDFKMTWKVVGSTGEHEF